MNGIYLENIALLRSIMGPEWDTAYLNEVLHRFNGDVNGALDHMFQSEALPAPKQRHEEANSDLLMSKLLHDMFQGTIATNVIDATLAELVSQYAAEALFDAAVDYLIGQTDMQHSYYPFFHSSLPAPAVQETKIKQVMKRFRPILLDKSYIRGVLDAMQWDVSAAVECIRADDSWSNSHALNNRHHATYKTALIHNMNGDAVSQRAAVPVVSPHPRSAEVTSSTSALVHTSTSANWEIAEQRCHNEASLHFGRMREAYRGAILTHSSEYAKLGSEHRRHFIASVGRAALLALQGRNDGLSVAMDEECTSITVVNLSRRLFSSSVLRIDLHGLTVSFAKSFVLNLFKYCVQRHAGEIQHIVFLVGRGLHSAGGVPQVSPALCKLFIEIGLKFVKLDDGAEIKVRMTDVKNCSI